VRLRTATFVAAALVGLAGCSGPPPQSGYVKKLVFHDRWTETIYTQMCVAYGKYGCTVSVPVATGTVEHPPLWCLLLVDDKDKKHEGELCFDKPEVYARYQPGQHYPDPR
jgi:hypothetical protein